MEDLQQVAKILNKNHFDARVVETVKDAVSAVMDLIPKDVSVGFGGSVTVRDLGLYEGLKEQGHDVFWHWMVDADDRNAARKSASNADYYLLSANALTKDGEIIKHRRDRQPRVRHVLWAQTRDFYRGQEQACGGLHSRHRPHPQRSPPRSTPNGWATIRPAPCWAAVRTATTKTACATLRAFCTGLPAGLRMHVILVNEDLGY